MKKGVLEMCILSQIAQKEMYGYEILSLVKQAFPEVHEATIYTILRRLHGDGFAETYYGTVSGGPQRKYYRITGQGALRLKEFRKEWRELTQAVRLLGAEVI